MNNKKSMYIHNLIKRTNYNILDLISEDCLNKFNSRFKTYYQKKKSSSEANIYDRAEQHTFKEYKKIMQEIPKGVPHIK